MQIIYTVAYYILFWHLIFKKQNNLRKRTRNSPFSYTEKCCLDKNMVGKWYGLVFGGGINCSILTSHPTYLNLPPFSRLVFCILQKNSFRYWKMALSVRESHLSPTAICLLLKWLTLLRNSHTGFTLRNHYQYLQTGLSGYVLRWRERCELWAANLEKHGNM